MPRITQTIVDLADPCPFCEMTPIPDMKPCDHLISQTKTEATYVDYMEIR